MMQPNNGLMTDTLNDLQNFSLKNWQFRTCTVELCRDDVNKEIQLEELYEYLSGLFLSHYEKIIIEEHNKVLFFIESGISIEDIKISFHRFGYSYHEKYNLPFFWQHFSKQFGTSDASLNYKCYQRKFPVWALGTYYRKHSSSLWKKLKKLHYKYSIDEVLKKIKDFK